MALFAKLIVVFAVNKRIAAQKQAAGSRRMVGRKESNK
jgi:hypothetical protein